MSRREVVLFFSLSAVREMVAKPSKKTCTRAVRVVGACLTFCDDGSGFVVLCGISFDSGLFICRSCQLNRSQNASKSLFTLVELRQCRLGRVIKICKGKGTTSFGAFL